MSMVLRTNMNSMNANRNLSINNSYVAKSIEKLASGFQINRAADDASGLAISEKMQAQITGLDQGTENALDGIGLVQTAEGAMEEIHNMLNRIVELSTKSANGTIQDEVDREAIQAEVDVLVDEIDRIAQSTNFNGIQLLDGSLQGGTYDVTTTTTETFTTENTPEVDTDVDVDTDVEIPSIDESKISYVGTFTITGGVDGTDFSYDNTTGQLTILSSTNMRIEGGSDVESIVVDSVDDKAYLTLKDVNITSATGSAFYTGDNDVYIELEGDNELSYDNGNSGSYGAAGLNVGELGSITINGGGVLTSTSNSMSAGIGSSAYENSGNIIINCGTITASSQRGAGIGSGYEGTVGDITINGGTITANGGVSGAGIGSTLNGTVGDITINGGEITATGGSGGAGIGSGGPGTVGNITISGGNIIADGKANSAGIGSGLYGTTGDITITGGLVTATGSGAGAGIGAGYGTWGNKSIVGNITYVEEIVTATGGIEAIDNIGQGTSDSIVGTITTIPYTPPEVEEDDTDTDVDTDPDVEYETTYTTTTTTTETFQNKGLILHVADQNNSYNKIQVYIDPMTGEALKIKPLYVDTQEFAGAAINIVKDAINYVSKNRGDLGALQNRLERTINNNNNTSENMTAARSAIKDCDMAKEMMEYTKMDVLTQASQSMLAQSNQAPQQVLSLLG